MAIVGFNESSLLNSEIYTSFRSSSTVDPVDKVRKLIQNARQLSKEDIETAYVQLKQYSNSLFRAALKAFDTGETVLLYNANPKTTAAMEEIIPFMTLRRGDKYVTYVFLDQHIDRSKALKGIYSLNSGKLMDLLVGALIAGALKTNELKLKSSNYLEKTLMSLYTSFVSRIINKEYLLGSEKIVYDSMQYYINRFFLTHIFNSPKEENIEILAKKHYRYVDPAKHEEVRVKYNSANPSNISELLKLISELLPRMSGLNLRIFVNKWMNYYFNPSTLAIDNIEYLIFMVVALKNGNNLINHIASDIVKETKNIKTFDEELLKLI